MINPLIQKRIIQAGRGAVPDYANETKIRFHYVTRTVEDEPTISDDSRKHSEPMELIIGKKFKFEPWEECLKTMAVGEIASFVVDKTLTCNYPIVAKSLRDIFRKDQRTHSHSQGGTCCAMTAFSEHGLGFDDLNKMLADPQPLEFILEVLAVTPPGGYKKEAWAMDSKEKTDEIPQLREQGNHLYQAGEYKQASEKYAQALGLLERLIMVEKPGSDEQKLLELQKVPLLLNYSQCLLLLQDYYAVIEHTTEALKYSPGNLKALYRRARAHAKVWNVKEAQEDYAKVVAMDKTMNATIQKELKELAHDVKIKNEAEKANLKGRLFT